MLPVILNFVLDREVCLQHADAVSVPAHWSQMPSTQASLHQDMSQQAGTHKLLANQHVFITPLCQALNTLIWRKGFYKE